MELTFKMEQTLKNSEIWIKIQKWSINKMEQNLEMEQTKKWDNFQNMEQTIKMEQTP